MSEKADSSWAIASGTQSRRAAPPQEWMLRIWQETCRHLEISDSTAAIARLLKELVPVQRVIVRQIDRQRGIVETLADTAAAESGEPTAVLVNGPLIGRSVVAELAAAHFVVQFSFRVRGGRLD